MTVINMCIRHEVCEALETYSWRKSAPVLHFSMYLGYSEFHVRRTLKQLVADGRVDRIEEGRGKNKPRYIYQLTQKPCDTQKP